jgi:hypothetical protein
MKPAPLSSRFDEAQVFDELDVVVTDMERLAGRTQTE